MTNSPVVPLVFPIPFPHSRPSRICPGALAQVGGWAVRHGVLRGAADLWAAGGGDQPGAIGRRAPGPARLLLRARRVHLLGCEAERTPM